MTAKSLSDIHFMAVRAASLAHATALLASQHAEGTTYGALVFTAEAALTAANELRDSLDAADLRAEPAGENAG